MKDTKTWTVVTYLSRRKSITRDRSILLALQHGDGALHRAEVELAGLWKALFLGTIAALETSRRGVARLDRSSINQQFYTLLGTCSRSQNWQDFAKNLDQ